MKNTNKLSRYMAYTTLAAGAATIASAQDAAVLNHMHEHYDAVVTIQAAVIAGSLEGTRESARWLVEHDAPAGMPAQWTEHVEAMRAAASATLAAQDLTAAATATSQLGLACGGCHVASNVSVEFDDVKRPSDKDRPGAHMERHQWAADRMWEGLIGPATVSWRQGANLLFESPLQPDELGAESGDEDVVQMSRRIHQLAGNATVVSDPAEKGEIYAEFLANCAACHTSLGNGPRP
jgi:hypothetical protein